MTQAPYDPSLTMVKVPSAIHGAKNLIMILRPNLEAPSPNYGTKNLQIASLTHLKDKYILNRIFVVIRDLIHIH